MVFGGGGFAGCFRGFLGLRFGFWEVDDLVFGQIRLFVACCGLWWWFAFRCLFAGTCCFGWRLWFGFLELFAFCVLVLVFSCFVWVVGLLLRSV